jgi:multiple sugar transport system ATP-binding protein
MSSVDLRQVNKQFVDHHAVKNVDITVKDSEFLVLLGPSGCGKSTLLRMIAGLELPSSGDIYIGDRRATRLAPRARNIAMVFQNYALYPHLSVYENIAFPLRIRHVSSAEVKQRVEWAASLVRIEHLLARKPRQTSGGERQRTALARCLVRNPEVFLFDEPLSNLDSKLRHSARDELREFHKKINVTAIYVTHDQVEAMGLGDRVVVMSAGEIRQVGTPAEVYTNPSDTFVATFLGSPPMNLIPENGSLLGFRPENFSPAVKGADNSDDFRIDVTVQRVEYLGNDLLIYGQGKDLDPGTRLISRLPFQGPIGIEVGDQVPFVASAPFLRRFDAASGKALKNGAALGRA